MEFILKFPNANNHFIEITLVIEGINSPKVIVNIPAWRPGRYEMAYYARNIRNFQARNKEGAELNVIKTEKSSWEIETGHTNTLIINYEFYAHQLDAGGSWIDTERIYINPINCCMYLMGRMNEEILVNLELESDYILTTGLEKISSNKLKAKDYYELSDSPILACKKLDIMRYNIGICNFEIVISGLDAFNQDELIADFAKFSDYLIKLFGEFPVSNYKFIIQILSERFYHGVEHKTSTSMVMGPAEDFYEPHFYQKLLGLACHELFHVWNVISIRPVELMNYDFNKENYFQTGFVAEGITTYYGDLILLRSGVLNEEWYWNEFNKVLEKHYENLGNLNLSVLMSSFDLWLDGYKEWTPNRKVSIYVKGSLIAFLIDIEIREITNNKKSMDDLMVYMWDKFGKPQIGYHLEDVLAGIDEIIGSKNIQLNNLIKICLYEKTMLESQLKKALAYLGFEFLTGYSLNPLESVFGLKLKEELGKWTVDKLYPNSPADNFLQKDDEIIAINNVRISKKNQFQIGTKEIEICFFRKNILYKKLLISDSNRYNKKYYVQKNVQSNEAQNKNYLSWLGQ